MKVFFTASRGEKPRYQKFYDVVVRTVQKEHEIISLEVQDYSYLIPSNLLKKMSPNEIHYTWVNKGIKKSNCVIVDASAYGFKLGHEATLALLYNKPVLCISDKDDLSTSIINPKFYWSLYKNESDIERAVVNFLKIVQKKHMSLRKNIYISPEHANFLDWYGRLHNRNDSEIIRDLIDELLKKHPEYYDTDFLAV